MKKVCIYYACYLLSFISDPEEFLNLLLKKILTIESFLKIRYVKHICECIIYLYLHRIVHTYMYIL